MHSDSKSVFDRVLTSQQLREMHLHDPRVTQTWMVANHV